MTDEDLATVSKALKLMPRHRTERQLHMMLRWASPAEEDRGRQEHPTLGGSIRILMILSDVGCFCLMSDAQS